MLDFKGSTGLVPTKQYKIDFIQDSKLNVVYFDYPMMKNQVNEIIVYYHDKSREAKTPPWDGGWIWRKDKNGNP